MWLLKDFKNTDWTENTVEKGEIAQFEQFQRFQECFPKAFFFNVLKRVCMEERVKCGSDDEIFVE